MGLKSLPVKARVFLCVIIICGITVMILALRDDSTKQLSWEFLALLLVSLLTSKVKIPLIRAKKNRSHISPETSSDESVSLNLMNILVCITLLHQGCTAAVLVGSLNIFVDSIRAKRKLHQGLFNVSMCIVEVGLSGGLFVYLNHGLELVWPYSIFPLSALALSLFLLNSSGIAIIIALCSSQKAIEIWRKDFLWLAPSFLACVSIATLAILFSGRNLLPALLMALPIAGVIYQSYRTQEARSIEKEAHGRAIAEKQQELTDSYLRTIRSLALAIDAKDQYTHQHIIRVQRYAVAIAQKMGFTEESLAQIKTSALLHDVGKIGIPEYVLLKPGKLTDEEFDRVKKHPQMGADILKPVNFPKNIMDGVKYHHEKWNGGGYPEGLKGTEIPLFGRILAVADVYDAVTSNRSYRKAWTHERALELIAVERNQHFDADIADIFLEVIEEVIQEMAQEGTGPLVFVTREDSEEAPPTVVRDLQRSSSELWAVYEVAQALSAHLNLSETLLLLSRKIETLLPHTAILFLLWETKETNNESNNEKVRRQLIVQSAWGINGQILHNAVAHSDSSRSLRVALEGKAYQGIFDKDDLLLTSSKMSTEQWTELNSALIL